MSFMLFLLTGFVFVLAIKKKSGAATIEAGLCNIFHLEMLPGVIFSILKCYLVVGLI